MNGNDPRVYYIDTEGKIVELAWTGRWGSQNVTDTVHGPTAISGAALAGFASRPNAGCVYYVDGNDHIVELACTANKWTMTDVTAAAEAPVVRRGISLVAYTIDDGKAVRLYYANADGQAVELTGRDGVWGFTNLARLV
jgi:hypothetical protein